MQNMNSTDLSQLSPKALKEYINAYRLPFKTAIEKSDLVRIIFNTKPISNENEMYYRTSRTKPIMNSTNNDGSNGGFFSNIVQDLFTPPSSNSPQEEQRRQHREQEIQRQRREQEQRREEQERRSRQEAERERLDRQRREQFLRQQQQSTPNTSPQQQPGASSPLKNNENVLSLHDMIKSNIDPASLSVRTLKSILKANFVEQSHVIEKSELVKLVIRLIDQHKADNNEGGDGDQHGGSNEDSLCRICFDAQQNCVLLNCGHMVTCMDCAKKVKMKKKP
jgi:hypothetical protein